ncbi:MAG: hypothetical protein IPO83_06615 [Chitinophagaceae bacterium]|nr:hypothetical protein [Chitinophagaceae bacterium]
MPKSGCIFLLAMLLITGFQSFSQVTNDARFNLMTPGIRQWFPGWYVSLTGDTVKGFIYLSNQIDNQVQFQYSTHNPPDMNALTIDAAKASGYLVKDRVYESLLMESVKNSSPAFVRRLEAGRLKLFAWYSLPANGTLHDGTNDRPITVNDEKFHESVFILKMGDGLPFFIPSSKNFAEAMSKLLADDVALASRISQKLNGYRSTDILNIVQQYNEWFSSLH